jgi:quinol monooxygenase YgiN
MHRSRREQGCVSHFVQIDCENPLRLVFIEQWPDRAALAAHSRGAGLTRLCPRHAAAGRGAPDDRDLRCHKDEKALNAEDA